MFDLRQAFDWLPEAVLHGTGAETVRAVSTDTRRLQSGDLFVALRGDNFDAHDFIGTAVDGGAAALVLERWTPRARPPALLVPDSRRALGWIAAGWRRRFVLPLIAVTGSNGKTTVKEMIASILAAHVGNAAAFATRGNLNNDVGVPLTLLALRAAHRAAVVEVGMNHAGEIAWLAGLVRPTVALVNNAQREHQEFLAGPEATAVENGAAISALGSDGVAVFPGDDPLAPIWRGLAGGRRTIEFGLTPAQTVRAAADSRPVGFSAHVGDQAIRIALNIAGRHNVRNALAAAACAHAIGVPPDTIAAGLEAFHPVAGRLRRLAGVSGFGLIDDSYNANPDSVRAAIDVLADEPSPRLLVLGEMGEVGDQGPAFHREVGGYARDRGVDALLAAGEMAREAVAAFGEHATHFDSVPALIASLVQWMAANGTDRLGGSGGPGSGGTVLVKGSRFMRMERVVQALAADGPTVAGGTH